MIARTAFATLCAALILGGGGAMRPAQAERLIVSVSNQRVTVTPNYSGGELVLFGSVEKDASTPADRAVYDLVVTVSGPTADMVTRRKERKFGIWINTDYRQFLKVPTYLALFSNRPFDAIASPEVQRRQQLGLNNVLLTQRVGPDFADVVPNDAFRSAFVRLREERGLYREETTAVTFLTPTLFRTGYSAARGSADRRLWRRDQIVFRGPFADTDRHLVRDRQGRLRTIRRHRRAPRRLRLWPRHRLHGADDRLDGLNRV